MSAARQRMARRAEALVALYLRGRDFEILGTNVRAGRLELDVVAQRGSLLVVCEVRSRGSRSYGSPVETLSRTKIGRVRRATAAFLRESGRRFSEVRLDAAAVTFSADGTHALDYFENAL